MRVAIVFITTVAAGLTACTSYAALQVTPFVVSTAAGDQRLPAISGPLVAFEDERTPGAAINIYLSNLDSLSETPYATGPGDQAMPAIFGTGIAWMDNRPGTPGSPNSDIIFSPSAGLQFNLTNDAIDQWWPSVCPGLVTWEEPRSGTSWDIAGFLTGSATDFYVANATSAEYESTAAYPWVVWKKYTNAARQFDVWARNLVTGETFAVAEEAGDQQLPWTDGRYVVWEDYRSGGGDIYLFDLRSRTARNICATAAQQWAPAVSGNVVVWQDLRNGNWDIYGYDLVTGQEFPVCTASGEQSFPRIDGGRVVWQDRRSGSFDIYGAVLSRSWQSLPDIAQAKMKPDASTVELAGRVVTADFGPYLYISDPNRNSGVRVSGYWGRKPGDVVTVRGVVATAGAEREILADSVTPSGTTDELRPLNIGTRFIGGKGFHPMVPNLTNNLHLHNAGLLLAVTGRVASVGDGWFYIDDGSNIEDGNRTGVQVLTTWTSLPQVQEGQFLTVAGICAYRPGSGARVQLLARSASDIAVTGP